MKNVFFVCLSHTLTDEQVASLNTTFGNGNIVLVSPELKAHTSQIAANSSLEEIQALATSVVSEAKSVNATHFICQGEPTFAMWANLMAGAAFIADWCEGTNFMNWRSMKCITSTTERVSVQTEHSDGSVTKTAVFKHVQWRNLF
jgi:hypothetical protein